MSQPRSFHASFTLLTLFTFLFNNFLSLSVYAQSFRPAPGPGSCSGFIEGQGLYVTNSYGPENNLTTQAFMIDLSVSWNTSNPVYKKLPGGPKIENPTCTMANNDSLFVLVDSTGYVYNVTSNAWSVLQNSNFDSNAGYNVATSDPVSGIVYIPTNGMDFQGKEVVLTINLRTGIVNTTELLLMDTDVFEVVAWSTALKRMVVFCAADYEPITFTLSETNKPTKGWGSLPNKGIKEFIAWNCMAPAYGGSKMVLFGCDLFGENGVVYIFDVIKLTWKKGPSTKSVGNSACAVTGDQFIIWGGEFDADKVSDATLVYNMKTDKWTTSFIAPLRPNTTTTATSYSSPPSQTSTQDDSRASNTPDYDDTTLSDKKLAIIIIIVTGALLTIILTTMFVYLGLSKRTRTDTQGTSPYTSSLDSLDMEFHSNTSITLFSKGSALGRDPSGLGPKFSAVSSDIYTQHSWHVSGSVEWLDRDPDGGRSPEHPHTIVEDLPARYSSQESFFEAKPPVQHPHAMVEQQSTASKQDYRGRHELEDE
ncbi:MAG: hypothetical protein J3Q66DRAFT_373774 [Benniella sp.]|nr:MAG: hypothetical protein J3Q66DRAFT_373774 [Benniella sp.]